MAEATFSDVTADMVAFEGKVSDRLSSMLGIAAKVSLVEQRTLERAVGRTRRVIDNRMLE